MARLLAAFAIFTSALTLAADVTDEDWEQLAKLVEAGKKTEAVTKLDELIRTNPRNEKLKQQRNRLAPMEKTSETSSESLPKHTGPSVEKTLDWLQASAVLQTSWTNESPTKISEQQRRVLRIEVRSNLLIVTTVVASKTLNKGDSKIESDFLVYQDRVKLDDLGDVIIDLAWRKSPHRTRSDGVESIFWGKIISITAPGDAVESLMWPSLDGSKETYSDLYFLNLVTSPPNRNYRKSKLSLPAADEYVDRVKKALEHLIELGNGGVKEPF